MNSQTDPRRPDKVRRFKPIPTNPLDDPVSDYMNLLGMVLSMCGLMMKMKWCSWCAIYCALIGFANNKTSDDAKQIFSSFMLSISSVVMSYMHNPEPLTPPWQ
ncbi:PAT complex subunit Asterix-like [Watersipora subatra]|uniref:PAT complex subunit Asterix-like n=1 Tax=Watersipora subatra TaxID=2589382 RepID=UPI00355C1ABB